MQMTYEKCPKHQQNDIILFCTGGNCMEPMCKECCKLHISWHNSLGTKPELDTIDSIRQHLLTDIQQFKLRFQEERAILHHFKDEGDGFSKTIHHKIEKVRNNLQKLIDEYLQSLEKSVIQKVMQHKNAHPTENKELYNKLDRAIKELEQQEKSLLQPNYMRALLIVMNEEKNHDFEKISAEIDKSVRHYLEHMFDLFVHDDHINELKQSLQHYVSVEPAHLEEELEHYTQKLRDGKKVFGIDSRQEPNPLNNSRQVANTINQPKPLYQRSEYQPASIDNQNLGYSKKPNRSQFDKTDKYY